MKTLPAVSVIIPVYNNEEYLRIGLNCILNQTLKNIEIICVNDGSTDSSQNILIEYAEKHEQIVILNQDNKGAGAARNYGFKYASGKYVYFFDSDDMCSPTMLEETVKIAENECADIVAFNFSRLNLQGELTPRKGYHKEWLPPNTTVFNYLDCPSTILTVINPTPWNKLYLRQFVQNNHLKFEEISSTNDITFAAVSAAVAQKIVVIEKDFYTYRVGHSDTISSKKSKNLNNVSIAVSSAVKQVSSLPYADTIRASIRRFEVDNYIFALKNYIPDFSAPNVKSFYDDIHNRFCSSDYMDATIESIGYRDLYNQFKIVQQYDYKTLMEKLNHKLIVSLTTYPARIKYVRQVLDTIYAQTKQADKVILWLAEEQFPLKEKALPQELLELVLAQKLTVRWCPDLKPHKKYFYALQEHPEDLIVTIDDDLLYHPQLLDRLYNSYLRHPKAVSAARAHLITISEGKGILPYKYWIKEIDAHIDEPSMQLLCTGGAGALYPPHIFNSDLFDKEAIMNTCLFADDLWLKTMELISDVPVVVVEPYSGLHYVPGSQTEALCHQNIDENQNDHQLFKINTWANQHYENNILLKKLTQSNTGVSLTGIEEICKCYALERESLKKEIRSLNKKLQKTYEEKSEINRKLQITYKEKAERGLEIKRLKSELENRTASFTIKVQLNCIKHLRNLFSKLMQKLMHIHFLKRGTNE